jgi:hypothetical protein
MPIDRLPDEILEHIFLAARDAVARVGDGPLAFASYNLIPLWKTLTHSTRRWRLVAIECATLWAVVSYSSQTEAWGWLALQRARAASLSVSITRLQATSNVTFLFPLISRMDKVNALSLRTVKCARNVPFNSTVASKLRHLEVYDSKPRWPQDQWPTDNMFLDPLPPLSTLKLHAHLNFSSPILRCSSITELNLRQPHISVGASVTTVVDILSHLPLLVSLTLQNVFQFELSDNNVCPSRLPHLHDMRLAETTPALRCVLSCVDPRVWNQETLPKLCVQEIGLIYARVPEEILYLSRIAASLMSFKQAWSQSIDAVRIVVHADVFWSIHLSSGMPRTAWLELQFCCANSQLRTPAHVFSALAALFEHTSEILIEEFAPSNAHAPSTQWIKILQNFPSAKSVRVAGPCSHTIVHAVIGYEAEVCDPLPGWAGDDPEMEDCLPQITELEVRDLEIDENELEALADWTRTRAETDAKLGRIDVSDVRANASKGKAEQAEEVVRASVGVVKWGLEL